MMVKTYYGNFDIYDANYVTIIAITSLLKTYWTNLNPKIPKHM